jgi:hypothetical protein
VTTPEVQQAMLDAAGEEELGSERPAYKVGRILAQMRLCPEARPGGKGSRRWRVTFETDSKMEPACGSPGGLWLRMKADKRM